MGNVPSRNPPTARNANDDANARPLDDLNSQDNHHDNRFRDVFLNLIRQMVSVRPLQSVPLRRASPVVPMAPDRPASTASSINSTRYNLRRTVTRIRREQSQRTNRSSTPRENSRIFDVTTDINSGDSGNPARLATPPAVEQMSPPMNTIESERVEPEQRRRRTDEEDLNMPRLDGPRFADNRTFPALELDEDDQGRSLYFTFPWRNNISNHNHIVLVRVRHLGTRPSPDSADSIDGALQWTLYFLLPQGSPMTTDIAQIAIDPAIVLAEAFAAFASLATEAPMGYEELIRLQEMMGFASRGVTTEKIEEQLKAYKYKKAELSTVSPTCTICLAEYQDEELMRKLPCDHAYHSECIDKWLNRVNHCPLCRKEAVGREAAAAAS